MLKNLQISESSVEEGSVTSNENVKIQLSVEERLQLEEQIRKFVQLVTQFYLLSFGNFSNPEENFQLNLINESSKQILLDLKNIALQNTTFATYNLTSALDIINEFEKMKDDYAKKGAKSICHLVKKTMFDSEVFMYPELLPKHGFIGNCQKKKVNFTKGEDNLIALGLERFSGEFDPIHKIQLHLLPTKKVPQIRIRIKNLRSSKAPKDNPIKYYYAHRKAPPISRNVQTFDPSKVKAPKHLNPSKLPEWIISSNSSQMKKAANPMKTVPTISQFFILPKGIIIQNHSMLYPVISQPLDFTRNNKNNFKTAKFNAGKVLQNKLAFILPKDIIKNDKEFHSKVGGKSKEANVVNMQDTDRTSIMLSEKINENSNTKHIIETHEVLDKNMTTHSYFLHTKSDKTTIASDIVIKTEVIEEICDSSQNESLGDCDMAKISSSSVLNGINNEQNLKFVESEIEKYHTKNAASVFEVTTLVQPHCIKQEITDNFEIVQACEFSPDVNTNKCNMFIKNASKYENDKKNINNSKHTLISKELSESIDYITDPNDKNLKNIDNGNKTRKYENSTKLKLKNNSILYPVISRQLDFIRNEKNSIKTVECNVEKVFHNEMFLPKVVKKNDKEFYSEADEKSHDTNNAVNVLQDIVRDKPSIMLSDKTNGNSDIESMIGTEEESDKTMTTHSYFLDNKTDKTTITSDIVIKTEIIEEECDSSQNESLEDYMTNVSSLLNEQNSKFVKSAIEKNDIENAPSIFDVAMLVEPHFIKQETTHNFKNIQTCEFSPDMNTDECNMFIKNTSKCKSDRQNINSSKHTLISKQLTESIDYIPDPNDNKSAVVIKSEIIEESNDLNPQRILLTDSIPPANDYNHSLQNINLPLENLPSINETNLILHNGFHTITNFPKSVQKGEQHDSNPMPKVKSNNYNTDTNNIADLTSCKEKICIKSEIIDDSETLPQNTSDVIFDKPVLNTTKNIIKSNSLEKAHIKEVRKTINVKRRKQKSQTKRKVRKKN